jgi:hypothetical protein
MNDSNINIQKKENEKKEESFHIIWTLIKKTLNWNDVMIFLLRLLFFFVTISFVLYLILKNEKPGSIEIKSAFFAFLLAMLPSIVRAFSLCFFSFYLETFTDEYVSERINENTLRQLGLKEDNEHYQMIKNIDNIKSIFLRTLSLAISAFISNYLRQIIDKGVIIHDVFKIKKKKKKILTAEEYIRQKDSPFNTFLGSILGGIVFTVFYFYNQQSYLKGGGIGPKKVLARAYQDIETHS